MLEFWTLEPVDVADERAFDDVVDFKDVVKAVLVKKGETFETKKTVFWGIWRSCR